MGGCEDFPVSSFPCHARFTLLTEFFTIFLTELHLYFVQLSNPTFMPPTIWTDPAITESLLGHGTKNSIFST